MLPAPADAIPAAPQASGFAIELGTGGLSGGSVGLGWGWARSALGLAVDYRRSDFGGDPTALTAETIESRLSVGPWARVELARALDGRVGLLAAIDLQYSWLSNEIKPQGINPQPSSLSATGIVLRAGPGIRWWATPWLAVGYAAQLSLSKLSLHNSAVSTPVAGATSSSGTDTEIALIGRFLVLAVF